MAHQETQYAEYDKPNINFIVTHASTILLRRHNFSFL